METSVEDPLLAHIYIKIVFTIVSLLGMAPNILIIFLYFKLNTMEMSSYSIFLITFAITEFFCSLSTLFTMNRLYISNLQDYYFMPLGPCNYINPFMCEFMTALQTGCLINITTLIPLSFAYRFYVVNNGAPRLRNIVLLVLVSVVPPIASVPLLSTTVIHEIDHNMTIMNNYHYFKYDKLSLKVIVIGDYLGVGLLLFPANFIFGLLIMYRIRKYSIFLTAKTVRLHKMLTKALFWHTIVHFIIVLTTGLYCLIALKIINFAYSDVLPSVIYGLIPFLNGTVCLFYVPHYHRADTHHFSVENEQFYVMNVNPFERTGLAPAPEIQNIEDSDIPTSFDSRTAWSSCSSLNSIHEQANCGIFRLQKSDIQNSGSCWAVSSASVISDRTCIASNGQVQIQASATDIMSCCKDCGSGTGGGCNGGIPLLAMQFWYSQGVVTGGDYQSHQGCKPYPFGCPCFHGLYNETTPQCTSICSNSQYSKTYNEDKHYAGLYYEVSPSMTGIQKEILAHGPVVTCFEQYADFNTYTNGIYVHTAGDLLGVHCVKVLGWGVDNGTPYWLAANSRGPNFGENGFFRILRGVDECGFEAVMAAGRPKL